MTTGRYTTSANGKFYAYEAELDGRLVTHLIRSFIVNNESADVRMRKMTPYPNPHPLIALGSAKIPVPTIALYVFMNA